MNPSRTHDWSQALDGDEPGAKRLWDLLGAVEQDAASGAALDVDAALRRVNEARADAVGAARVSTSPARVRMRPRRVAYRILAAAAVLVGLLVVVNLLVSRGTSAAHHAVAYGDAPETIHLADLSEVTLQPGSELHYSADARSRVAHLGGSADFEVSSDPQRPFTVSGEGYELRVVGTGFRISTRPDGDTEVAVREGHVRLRGAREADWTDLLTGQSAVVRGAVVEARDGVRGSATPLAFSEATLSEVVAALARERAVTLEVPAPLRACRVTADFSNAEAADIARALAELFGAQVRLGATGASTYRLVGGACP